MWEPANKKFFLPSARSRILFSMALLSGWILLSSKKGSLVVYSCCQIWCILIYRNWSSCNYRLHCFYILPAVQQFLLWTKCVFPVFPLLGIPAYSGDIGFFVNFGDYIYFKLTFLSITPFSMKFPVNISPSSWSFVFFLLVTKYEISPKLTKNPL